jgi:hypothetical protein
VGAGIHIQTDQRRMSYPEKKRKPRPPKPIQGHEPTTPPREMIDMRAKLEKAGIFHEVKGGPELASMLRRYRLELQQVANANKKQTTFAAFFPQKQLL